GENAACALLENGVVTCWGGTGPHDGMLTASATHVAAAGNLFCAALASGAVSCWGSDLHGTIGAATGVRGATSIAVGYNHACAVVDRGEVGCWRGNYYGQLGDG